MLTPGALFSVVSTMTAVEKERWKKIILQKMPGNLEKASEIPLEALIAAVYSRFDASYDLPHQTVIAYGAGQFGQRYIPGFSSEIEVCEIWDAYTKKKDICGIPIQNSIKENVGLDIPIVIFIEEINNRYNAISSLKKKGHSNLFYFKHFISVIHWMKCISMAEIEVPDELKKSIEKLCEAYETVDSPELPIVFSALPVSLKKEALEIKQEALKDGRLRQRLEEVLTIDNAQWLDIISIFENADFGTIYSFTYNLEIFLRKLLSLGVKTKERPMRMEGDTLYDEFAAYTILNEVWKLLFCDKEYILQVIHKLEESMETNIPFQASECYFEMESGRPEAALEIARRMVSREPNDLLANEILYQAIFALKEKGISVDEPIPEYDLSERFCWCGVNFAWCGSFDAQSGAANFAPCFRPLQCAARPEGEFWSGEDWKEFRKSVTDGSFRYCQKNQCPNIVGGWLPKKSDCEEGWLKQILEGEVDVIPPLEELHLSYDGHCNLKCPSCRLEIRTNTREQNEKFDELYKKSLSPYIKNAKHLTLSGCGEAILSPHSKNVLQSFSKKENPELMIELRTNATVINPKTWEELGEGRHLIRHITPSIDAATKESFEKLRYPAKWEIVLKNLEFIQSLRNAGEIDMLEFHVVISEENINQLYDIAMMAIDYDADAVTYSKIINWRDMPEEEYRRVNPFWWNHPRHEELKQELNRIEQLRDDIEAGKCHRIKDGKKVYLSLHFRPDLNSTYDEIRWGRLKIR
ncbi:MAG: radical SAM protein [Lachnospiraceae bacterium]|nr:radical SAM protein [Lachnospiraceae bacterium]